MAYCGEKYAHLVTAGGWGPENPTGGKPWYSEADVDLWSATASLIHDEVQVRRRLLRAAEKKNGNRTAKSVELDGYLSEYEKEYAGLPTSSWWQAAGMEQETLAIVNNAKRGACVMELLDEVLATTPNAASAPKLGGKIRDLQGWQLAAAGALGLVGLLGIIWVMR